MVTAITGIVLAVVYSYYPVGSSFWQRSAALAEAHQHGRIALEEVVHELQYAHRVVVDQDNGVVTYWKDVDGELKRYRLYLQGRQLLVDLPGGPAVPLAGCVERLWVQPGGTLRQGEVLMLVVRTSWEGYGVVLRSAVEPRNLEVGL